MKKDLPLIILAAGIVLAIYLLFFNKSTNAAEKEEEKAPENKPGNSTGNSGSNPGAPPAAVTFPLKYGSRGAEVKTLQQMYNRTWGGLADDGIFGSKTLQALKLNTQSIQVTEKQYKAILAAFNKSGTMTQAMFLDAMAGKTTNNTLPPFYS